MPKGKTTSKLCPICNRFISMFVYNRHVKIHDKPPIPKWEPKPCEFCSKNYDNKNAYSNHKIRCPQNPNRVHQKMTEIGKEKSRQANVGRKWSVEKKLKHSFIMKQAVRDNPDSYSAKNVCGRVKLIEYNGHILHGSWELEVAKWLDRNELKWAKKVDPFDYYWNSSWHLYFPDFYVIDCNVYLEVKGYETERDRCKWAVVPNLIVIKKNEINLIKQNKFGLVTHQVESFRLITEGAGFESLTAHQTNASSANLVKAVV